MVLQNKSDNSNEHFEDVYRRNVPIFEKTSWKTKLFAKTKIFAKFRENLLIFASFSFFAKMEKPCSFQPYLDYILYFYWRWLYDALINHSVAFELFRNRLVWATWTTSSPPSPSIRSTTRSNISSTSTAIPKLVTHLCYLYAIPAPTQHKPYITGQIFEV
jgi:hypothetical protein